MNFTFNLGGNNNRDYEVGKQIQVGPVGSIIFGIIITIMGIVLTIFLINYDKTLKEKDKTFININAYVVENEYDMSDEMYTPIFEYEVNGVKYKGESNHRSTSKEQIGTTVGIKYNPSDPKDYIMASDVNSSSMFFILGIVFAAAGILVVVTNIPKLGKNADQIKEFTENLYNNDVDSLYGTPAPINSTITYVNEPTPAPAPMQNNINNNINGNMNNNIINNNTNTNMNNNINNNTNYQ